MNSRTKKLLLLLLVGGVAAACAVFESELEPLTYPVADFVPHPPPPGHPSEKTMAEIPMLPGQLPRGQQAPGDPHAPK